MAVNYSEKHAKKLDQAFTAGSYTKRWIRHDADFDGVKTIKVYTLASQELNDYNRNGTGDRFGGNHELQDTIATYTLEKDRSFKIALDAGNVKQTGESRSAGRVMKLQMDERYIPEYDTNVFAKAYAATVATGQTIALNTANPLKDVMKANAKLASKKAPRKGRVIMMTPDFHVLVKDQIVQNTHADAAATKTLGEGYVGKLDGIPAVEVPAEYFPADANVQALVWHKSALVGHEQAKTLRVDNNPETIDGSLVMGRFIFDAFAMEAKKDCIVAITGTITEA